MKLKTIFNMPLYTAFQKVFFLNLFSFFLFIEFLKKSYMQKWQYVDLSLKTYEKGKKVK